MKKAQNEAAGAVNTDGQESGVRSNPHPSYSPLGGDVNEHPDRGPMIVTCAGCEITETDEDLIFRAGRWWHDWCWDDARDEAIGGDPPRLLANPARKEGSRPGKPPGALR